MKNILFILIFISSIASAQTINLKNWMLVNASQINVSDKEVSQKGIDLSKWYKVEVPVTVLNSFVRNGVYPDPRIGMNNYLIPDVSDKFNQKMNLSKYSYLDGKRNPWKDPYWYRIETDIPSSYTGKNVWLNLYGINYRADVWINGKLVADRNKIYGMFRRFRLNITDNVIPGKKNCFAIKIYQVDHPGDPNPGTQFTPLGPVRGQTQEIFKDETQKMSAGWDCAPVVRDRNIGIYQKVTVEATDAVSINNPFVVTSLPDKDNSRAELSIMMQLKNLSNQQVKTDVGARITLVNDVIFPTYVKHMSGKLKPIDVVKNIVLEPNETKDVCISYKDYPQLIINNPYLWYPNGYGEQYLHHLKLTCSAGNKHSDCKEFDFGIRQVSKEVNMDKGEAGLVYYINHKKVFCKGGWIQPDILLDETPKRINDECRLMANANVNLIGSEDMPSPSDEWLECCDKYGLMWWHVFMQCWRMFPGTETEHYPLDHNLAVADVEDIVLRYRNHPSIISWFGVNEVLPDEDLYTRMKAKVLSLDTTRPYIPTTSTCWDIKKYTPYLLEDWPTGTTDDGAPDYNWAPPEYFFNKVNEVYLQKFRNEMGIPSIPMYSSVKRFISTYADENKGNNPIYPLDSIWAEHGAWDVDNYCFRSYDNAIRALYGTPKSTKDYCDWGQLISADGYRAMFEAANHRMWNITSGIMIWKINSCWPDVGWQMYDWYLNPTAAYYFAKKAMEPVHIQMNANDFKVSVINATFNKLNDLNVSVRVIDRDLNEKWKYSTKASLDENCCKEVVKVPNQGKYGYNYFVELELRDSKDNVISTNLYCLYSQHMDFTFVKSLENPKLTQTMDIVKKDGEYQLSIGLENRSDKLSYFNHLSLVNNHSEEILPVFWSDNFITLFPGDKKTIKANVAISDVGECKPKLVINQ